MGRRWLQALTAALLLATGFPIASQAHQPVMDMAPRWQGGWGFQVRNEHRSSNALYRGDKRIENTEGKKRTVNTTWLEGVYTFKREVRLTAKIPWVEHNRTFAQGGSHKTQTGSGLGDAIFGLQLKRYFNRAERTANFGITPSIRVPSGSSNADYPVGDGSWDVGLSTSFSTEVFQFYQFYDLFYWHNSKGERNINRGDEVGLDVNIGVHPFHDNERNMGMFLMGDLSVRFESRGRDTRGVTGGSRVSLGPVLVLYWNNLMFRAETKVPVYQFARGTQVGRGTEFNAGLGVTF
jgi:hypothetical protein